MKAPVLIRLRREDFKGASGSWVESLIRSLNGVLDALTSLYSGGLDLKENLGFQFEPIKVSIGSSFNAVLFSIKTISKTATGCIPVQVKCLDDANLPIGAIYVDWELLTGGKIRIKNISGLTADHKYELLLMVIP